VKKRYSQSPECAGGPLANVRLSVLLGGNVVASAISGSVGQYSFRIDGREKPMWR
jgi:hypothetical protein